MSSPSSAAEAVPPWLELPRDITAAILHKLGAIDILTAAQYVCTEWQSVCRDPSMWRCIDMRDLNDRHEIPYNMEEMCRHAVNRSQGQLIDINIEFSCTDELLIYICQRSSQLRRLELTLCYEVTSDCLVEAVENFPLLEELHLYYTYVDSQDMKAIGRSCPHLKSFTSTCPWEKGLVYDEDARAIAKTMPQLRHLRLIGNPMTDAGLQAILDGCPHLESLDLRQCFNICFGGNIGRLCTQRIRDLRRPNDSTEDYPFAC